MFSFILKYIGGYLLLQFSKWADILINHSTNNFYPLAQVSFLLAKRGFQKQAIIKQIVQQIALCMSSVSVTIFYIVNINLIKRIIIENWHDCILTSSIFFIFKNSWAHLKKIKWIAVAAFVRIVSSCPKKTEVP